MLVFKPLLQVHRIIVFHTIVITITISIFNSNLLKRKAIMSLIQNIKSSKIHLLVLFCLCTVKLIAQPCAPLVPPTLFGQSQTFIYCKNNTVGFGVLNSAVGQKYTFSIFGNGNVEVSKKGGPLDGNGGQLSVSAIMRSARDAGIYSVKAKNACGDSAGVAFAAFYGSIDNLSISSWGGNAVSFNWAPSGPQPAVTYEYAVTTQSDPNSTLISFATTTDTTKSEINLINAQTYYIHVRVKQVIWQGNLVYQSFDCSGGNLPWETLKFVSCSGAAGVGTLTPPNAIACTGGGTLLTASGGSPYQWYKDNNPTPIAGANASTYTATETGQFRSYITTGAGCRGIVHTSTVLQTIIDTGIFSGSGNFYAGDTVKLGISNTIVGQTYNILKDGSNIQTVVGIGKAFESKDTVWYRYVLSDNTGAGHYTVKANNPYCPSKTFGSVDIVLISGITICPGSSTSFTVPSAGAGYTYQWQESNGIGSSYVNLTNGPIYSGVATRTLTLTKPPTSLYNYTYRCIATGATTVTSSTRKLKFGVTWLVTANKQWTNAANWNCGVVPDANTDVIIPAGTLNQPVITSNVSCRSVTTSAGSVLTINPGVKLIITGN